MSFDNNQNMQEVDENAGEFLFHRKEMDESLYALAKECKKIDCNQSEFEIVLVGESSIVLNYNFRDTTFDFDTIFMGSRETFKEAIKRVADQKGHKIDWMNDDFKKTSSYSNKLVEHSRFYKKFANCLSVRTVDAEYLLAMKIQSARVYTHDMSDIIGVIKEHLEREKPISYDKVAEAYRELYGQEMTLPKDLDDDLKKIFSIDDYEELYYKTVETENQNRTALKVAMTEYKDLINEGNVNQFITAMKRKKQIENDIGYKMYSVTRPKR